MEIDFKDIERKLTRIRKTVDQHSNLLTTIQEEIVDLLREKKKPVLKGKKSKKGS